MTAHGVVCDRYDATGERTGAPLLVLHGLFGSRDNWQSQARALADTRDVLVADMPNHGDSLFTEAVTFEEVADLLWTVVDELAGDTVSLLGHSMGGKVAMAMALRQPKRCTSLTVVDIAPRVYGARHDGILKGMDAVSRAAVLSRSEADRILQEWVPEKAVRLFLLKSLVPREEGGVYHWKLNLPVLKGRYHDISDWTITEGRYDGPVLLVRGALSPYVTDEDTAAMEALFPGLQVRTIGDTGHWVHAERRDEFLSVVRSFIS